MQKQRIQKEMGAGGTQSEAKCGINSGSAQISSGCGRRAYSEQPLVQQRWHSKRHLPVSFDISESAAEARSFSKRQTESLGHEQRLRVVTASGIAKRAQAH